MNQDVEYPPEPKNAGEATGLPATRVEECGQASVQFVREGKSVPQLAFFIHGTPGRASDWAAVMEELERSAFDCECVSLDRPGFGKNRELADSGDFERQIDAFVEVLDRVRVEGRSLVLVGHSYGAALALGLAVRLGRESALAGLVLVSGVLSPEARQFRWYHKLALSALAKPFTSRRSRLAALEMKGVGAYLSEYAGTWGSFDFPVTFMHGDADWLVPIENSRYACGRMGGGLGRLVEVPKGRHALTHSHPQAIAEEIERIFRLIDGRAGE